MRDENATALLKSVWALLCAGTSFCPLSGTSRAAPRSRSCSSLLSYLAGECLSLKTWHSSSKNIQEIRSSRSSASSVPGSSRREYKIPHFALTGPNQTRAGSAAPARPWLPDRRWLSLCPWSGSHPGQLPALEFGQPVVLMFLCFLHLDKWTREAECLW